MTVNIGLCGASGQMGQAIKRRITQTNYQLKITGEFDTSYPIATLKMICQNADIVMDFSSPELLAPLLKYSRLYHPRLIIGTTGFKPSHFKLLQQAASKLVIIYSSNMSAGANLLNLLVAQAAKILASDYDVEILDSHHRLKKDAPSGTALMLGKSVAMARGQEFDQLAILDQAASGQRRDDQIGFSSIRGGSNCGEHQVLFLGDNETITLKHQALNRDALADGAIKAAIWSLAKPPGLYSMLDVLSLSLLR